MSTCAQSVKPIFKPLVFQARRGCAEHMLWPRQDEWHIRSWTRGVSNHCHCAARALGVVLFLIGNACIMCYFLFVFGNHFQRAGCHVDVFAIQQHLKYYLPQCIQSYTRAISSNDENLLKFYPKNLSNALHKFTKTNFLLL